MLSPDATAALQRSYKMALLPVAIVAIEEGRITQTEVRLPLNTDPRRRHAASIIANYAATDLVLVGKTVWFTPEEVAEVLPEFAVSGRSGISARTAPEYTATEASRINAAAALRAKADELAAADRAAALRPFQEVAAIFERAARR